MKKLSAFRDESKFLFSIVSPYKRTIFLFLSVSLISSLFDGVSIGLLIPVISFWQGGSAEGSLPLALHELFQFMRPYTPAVQLIFLILFVTGAILLKNLFVGFAFRQGLFLSNRVTADVRSKVLKVLMTVGVDYHYRSKIGELIDKTITHTELLKELIIAMSEFIVFSMMFLILFILMVILSWQLTLYAVGLGLIFMVLLSMYLQGLTRHGVRNSMTSRELTCAVQENLSAVHLIQSYNKQQQQLYKLKEKIEDHAEANMHSAFRLYWVQPITEGMGAIAIGLLLIISLVLLPEGNRLSLVILLPLLYILLRNVQTLRLLNRMWGVILFRWPCLKQVHDLVREDNKPFIPDGDLTYPGGQKEIVFDRISFLYQNGVEVLKDLSFSIPLGKTTAIVGGSGVGKSTIVNLLLRFYDPQRGEVRIDDRSIRDYKVASYRQRFGIVSQETFIFNESVRFNIGFSLGAEVPESLIVDAASRAGAHEFISELPDKYDTLLGDRGVKLSGGQRQRISIARAILKDPEVLILDEATSSLDAITEQQIHDTLFRLAENRTIIIIAHRPSTVQNAGRIIVLKEGAVAEVGTPQELLSMKGEYYALMHLK